MIQYKQTFETNKCSNFLTNITEVKFMGVYEFMKEMQILSEDQKEIIIVENNCYKRFCVMGCCKMVNTLYIEGMDDDECVEISNISYARIEKDKEKYEVTTETGCIKIFF